MHCVPLVRVRVCVWGNAGCLHISAVAVNTSDLPDLYRSVWTYM